MDRTNSKSRVGMKGMSIDFTRPSTSTSSGSSAGRGYGSWGMGNNSSSSTSGTSSWRGRGGGAARGRGAGGGVKETKKRKMACPTIAGSSVPWITRETYSFTEEIVINTGMKPGTSSGTSSGTNQMMPSMKVKKGKKIVYKRKQFKLSQMQQTAADFAKRKISFLFSGVAGTGKSYLLDYLKRFVLPFDKTIVTASTGMAALQISGTTLHSWAGIGLGKESKEELFIKVNQSDAADRWRKAEVLIIDEISMIDSVLLDKLDYVARMVRMNSSVFGGLQVILSGDFLQLPPVEKVKNQTMFAFNATCWPALIGQNVVLLDTVYRQKDGSAFVHALNEMRQGRVASEADEMFKSRVGKDIKDIRKHGFAEGIQPTLLFSKKCEVAHINNAELDKLPGETHTYDWQVQCRDQYLVESLKKNFNGAVQLNLKVGAQVMLVKNLGQGSPYVNGSRAIVRGFATVNDDLSSYKHDNPSPSTTDVADSKDTVDGKDGKEVITIDDEDDSDFSESKKKKGSGSNSNSNSDEDDVSDDDDTESGEGGKGSGKGEIADDTLYPVVQFAKTGEIMLLTHKIWETKVGKFVLAKIYQIPLILGWAITIHKCQGMTLDVVQISMAEMFEYAQAYVAFSRVKSLEGLYLLDWDREKITASPKALKFYREMQQHLDLIFATLTSRLAAEAAEASKQSSVKKTTATVVGSSQLASKRPLMQLKPARSAFSSVPRAPVR